jgi:hypothetical protein
MASSVRNVPRGAKNCLTQLDVSTRKKTQLSGVERGAILKDYVWDQGQEITIGFLEGTPSQQDFVKKTVLETWQPLINLKLSFIDDPTNAVIRVGFDPNLGSWSYIGKQNKNIPKSERTINLGWLDDEEGLNGGVIKHEFGHMLGFAHEHLRSDKEFEWNEEAVYNTFSGPPNNWSRSTIDTNIFDTVNTNQFIGTKYDDKSIMVYIFDCSLFKSAPQSMPCNTGSIQELSPLDKATVSSVYPKNNNVDVTQKIKNLSGNVINESGFIDMVTPSPPPSTVETKGTEKTEKTVGTLEKPVTKTPETPPTLENPMTKKTTTRGGLSWQDVISIILGILSLIMLVCIIYILISRRKITPVKSTSSFTFT